MRSPITTHVLDTALGCPAEGIPVLLEVSLGGDEWKELAVGTTDADGRISNLLPVEHVLIPGVYRITFGTSAYYEHLGETPSFYPLVPVIFEIKEPGQHYHVPLLLSPYGYSTYRGS